MAEGQARGPSSFLPRPLHRIDAHDLSVLDLSTPAALAAVGLEVTAISDSDWAPCQRLGEHAAYLNLQGILAPSATGTGLVLAAFELKLRPGQPELLETFQIDDYFGEYPLR